MKKRNIVFRLVLTLFFVLLAIYHLYPTFRYNNLVDERDQEILELARMTGASAPELQRAVVEGRTEDVMEYVSAREELASTERVTAKEKVDQLMGDFAEKLERTHRHALRLGLDLQGGMHLVLEVDLAELMRQLAKNPDTRFDSLMAQVSRRLADPDADFNEVVLEVFEQSDVRLSRYFLEAQSSDRQVLDYLSEEADDAIARSLEILRNRVDQFGVAEPDRKSVV